MYTSACCRGTRSPLFWYSSTRRLSSFSHCTDYCNVLGQLTSGWRKTNSVVGRCETKRWHITLTRNFRRCSTIFRTLSAGDSAANFEQNHLLMIPRHINTSLRCLLKYEAPVLTDSDPVFCGTLYTTATYPIKCIIFSPKHVSFTFSKHFQ